MSDTADNAPTETSVLQAPLLLSLKPFWEVGTVTIPISQTSKCYLTQSRLFRVMGKIHSHTRKCLLFPHILLTVVRYYGQDGSCRKGPLLYSVSPPPSPTSQDRQCYYCLWLSSRNHSFHSPHGYFLPWTKLTTHMGQREEVDTMRDIYFGVSTDRDACHLFFS